MIGGTTIRPALKDQASPLLLVVANALSAGSCLSDEESRQHVNPLEAQMMMYILLAYRDENRWEAMSAGERAAFEEASQASDQDLIRSLHLIDVRHLQENAALTVRIVNGQASLSEGPIPGSQEQLIQLLFIQANDLNAAVQLASRMPQARVGSIEVRPVVLH